MMTQTQPTQNELDAHWGYLYRIIHKQSGRQYIGQHRHKVGEDFEDYYGSGSIITSAILFEGRDAFKKEFICFVESKEIATVKEIEAITALVSSGAPYYNIMFTDKIVADALTWPEGVWDRYCKRCAKPVDEYGEVIERWQFAICEECVPEVGTALYHYSVPAVLSALSSVNQPKEDSE